MIRLTIYLRIRESLNVELMPHVVGMMHVSISVSYAGKIVTLGPCMIYVVRKS
jgi:hypothetical protein